MSGEQLFERILNDFTLAWEGMGFEDDPADPGGATKMGITDREYQVWRSRHQLRAQSVKVMGLGEATDIYRASYWNASHCPQLAQISAGIAAAVFDTSVNLGVGRGTTWLQLAVGVTADGVIGPKTLWAVQAADFTAVIKSICQRRLDFRQARVRENESQLKFFKGWCNRDKALQTFALGMVGVKAS